MSDKDLVFCEEVLAKAYHHSIDGRLIISAYDVERIHAVQLPMSAAEYIHISNRMLKEDYRAWDRLLVFEENDDADKAIAWIKEWAAEHPEKKRKTYAEDFKERCPNHLHNCGMPIVCRNEVYGFGGRCTVEEAVKRGGCSSCWNEVMEDEG